MENQVHERNKSNHYRQTEFEQELASFYEEELMAPPGAGRQTLIREEVLEALQARIRIKDKWGQYSRDKDAHVVFTHAYLLITEAIQAMVANYQFEHREWLAALDFAFAKYYLEALDTYLHDDKANVPEAWQYAFAAIGVGEAERFPPKATILEALILPLIVHAVHDLPFAVAELAIEEAKFLNNPIQNRRQALLEAMIPAYDYGEVAALRSEGIHLRDFQGYIHDFMRVNELLFRGLGHQSEGKDQQHRMRQEGGELNVIQIVQDAVSRYNPLLKWLDRMVGKQYDEILTAHALQVIRGMAWFDATRLVEARSRAEYYEIRRSIVDRTKQYIDAIHTPRSWLLRILLQVSRFVSGLFRT